MLILFCGNKFFLGTSKIAFHSETFNLNKVLLKGGKLAFVLVFSDIIHIEDSYRGYISFVKVHEVTEKIQVEYPHSETILFDSGYSCLVFLPDHQNWCAGAVYDSNNEIVEWYFDIVVSPTFEITLLDEKEVIDKAFLMEFFDKHYAEMNH